MAGPNTRSKKAKRALSRVDTTTTAQNTKRRIQNSQDGSLSGSRQRSASPQITKATPRGGSLVNCQLTSNLHSSPSQTGTVSARLESREVSRTPFRRHELNDNQLQNSSERRSPLENIRTENVGRAVFQTPNTQPANPSIPCNSCLTVGIEINELKGRVRELQEDKGFARNTISVLSEENTRLKQRVDILQKSKKELFDQVEKLSKRNSMKSSVRGVNSKHRSPVVRLPEAEQTIFDRASNMMEQRLFADITESTTDEEGRRLRDWIFEANGSSRIWVLNDASDMVGRAMIRMGNLRAVPVCPLEQAKSGGMFTSRYNSNENFIHNLLLDAVERDDPPLIPIDEREATLGNLERMITPLYNSKKRKLTSDLKKRAKCRFLSALGYSALGRISSVSIEAEQRERERGVLSTKLSRETNGTVDVSWWRRASFAELRYNDDIEESDEFVPDLVFNNSAAVAAFQTLRGYNFSEGEFLNDGTVLSITRADSWITACMKLMKEKRSKGGNTGSLYVNEFDRLLPIATEQFLRQCRNVIKDKFQGEFVVQYGNNNPFMVSRGGTRCFRMPQNKHIYLAVRSSVFINTFTKHLGNVMDCYVGRAHQGNTSFHALSLLDEDDDCDTSDEEEQVPRNTNNAA